MNAAIQEILFSFVEQLQLGARLAQAQAVGISLVEASSKRVEDVLVSAESMRDMYYFRLQSLVSPVLCRPRLG